MNNLCGKFGQIISKYLNITDYARDTFGDLYRCSINFRS